MNKKKFIFLSTLFFAFSFNINDSYAKDQIYDQKLEEYDKNIEEDKSIKSEETSDDLELKDDSLNEKKGSEESEESNEITEKEDLDTDTSKEMIEDKTSGEILEENAEEAEEENYDNSIHTEVSSQTSNINKYLEEKESINIDKKDLTFGKEINLLSIKKQNLNKQELKNKWIIENGKKYYLGEDGKKVQGLYEIKGNTYYFDKNGLVVDKYIVLDKYGKYKIDSSGKATLVYKARPGWVTTKEDAYYFDQNNRLIRGRRNVGGNYYIFDSATGSILRNGFKEYENKIYYLDYRGVILKGIVELNRNKYYFTIDDGMVKNKEIVADSGKYQTDSKGRAFLIQRARPGWMTTKEDAYFFDQNNKLIRGRRNVGGNYYIFDFETGKILRNGFKVYDNKTYYVDDRGVILKGIVELNRNKYYFTI
ncbi:MAG: hypothetical protein Q4B36_01305, partial [Tissierellia bacterium]|nr:hypothetical protein [Tissierellia bacterium]